LPDTPMPAYRPSPLEVREWTRDVLAGAGLSEVVTHALVSPQSVERFPAPDERETVMGEGIAQGAPITLTNPLSSQHSMLRQRLIGSLLDVVRTNVRQDRLDVAVFEIGKGYGRVGDRSHEWWRLGFALTGPAEPRAWNRDARDYDLADAKAIIELLARKTGLGAPQYEPLAAGPTWHPGRSVRAVSRIRSGASKGSFGLLADVGELHPRLIEELEIRAERVIVAEVALHGLAGGQLPVVRAVPVPRVPAVERDLAVVVPAARTAADVEAAIRARAGDLLRDVRLFDVYPLPDGNRSLAYRLVLQAPDRTLTDPEIDKLIDKVVGGLEALGGRLRG